MTGSLRCGSSRRWSAAWPLVAMIVVGCSTVTEGTPTVNGRDAPAYRTSVSASLAESAASSSARESERQASLTTEAVHTACEALSTSSADAIDAVNAYVEAFNDNAGGPAGAPSGRPSTR